MATTKNVPPASLAQRLAGLRERMLRPAYEDALDHFLTVVAVAPGLHEMSEPGDSPGLRVMLGTVVFQLLGPGASLQDLVILHVSAHAFDHGCAAVGGRAMAFCFCQRLNVGIMGLYPGLSGPTEVVRFRLARSPTPAADN